MKTKLSPEINPLRLRRRVQKIFTKPSKTQQSAKNETDINLIMAKYQKTGLVTHVSSLQKTFADVSHSYSYHDIKNAQIAADQAFLALPSSIRARFANDPGNLLNFLQDSNNRDEAIRLGLISKKPIDTPSNASNAKLDETQGSKNGLAETPVSGAKGA